MRRQYISFELFQNPLGPKLTELLAFKSPHHPHTDPHPPDYDY